MLVIEHMVHGDLGEYWKKNPPLSGDVVVMLAQILQALSYLHQKETTHRDIKPSNILVHRTLPFIAKLADFGLSSTKYLSKTFCGSPLYLAPEAIKAKRNRDRKSGFHWYDPGVDVWSLGIVGLQYSSRLPIYINTNDYYRRVSQLVRHQPGPLGEVLQEMLKTDPEQRANADDAFTMLKSTLEQRNLRDASDSIDDGKIQWKTYPLGLSTPGFQFDNAEEGSILRRSKRLFGELSGGPNNKSEARSRTQVTTKSKASFT